MRKNIIYIFLSLSLLLAIVFYLISYSINLENMENKISNYLEVENVTLISHEYVKDNEDYLFVHYSYDNGQGIALLSKGFNNRYNFRNAFYTSGSYGSTDMYISRKHYVIGYGVINKDEMNSAYMIVGSTMTPEESALLESLSSLDYDGESFTNERKSSGPRGMVEVQCILIVFLTYILTYPLRKKFRRFSGKLQGQRLHQLHW